MKRSVLQKIIFAIGATAAGAWFFAHIVRHVDRWVWRLSGQRTTLTAALAGLPIVVLTTTGAQSGIARTQPLVAFDDPAAPGAIAIIGSNFGQRHTPGWYFNLRKHPRASGRLANGVTHIYRAEEISGAAYDAIWQRAVAQYPGYAQYKRRASHRVIPIMRLIPLRDSKSE